VRVCSGFPRARSWLATKLTQSPWFLNVGLVKLRHPPFMHCAVVVGAPRAAVGVRVAVNETAAVPVAVGVVVTAGVFVRVGVEVCAAASGADARATTTVIPRQSRNLLID
jgi:hypothetical protein